MNDEVKGILVPESCHGARKYQVVQAADDERMSMHKHTNVQQRRIVERKLGNGENAQDSREIKYKD